MTTTVEISNLRKVFSSRKGETVAIANLDLTIGARGTVHGFLGPNGSGKTTTIRCMLGLIRPTSGSVTVMGQDSSSAFHRVASKVGAVVENPKLFPNFSAQRNLSLLADIEGLDHSNVARVLEIVGLSERADDTFGNYSLGMKQRLAIGAALLKDPDLLILDEPANGLDPAGIAEIRRLIRQMADEGKAVLVSSHQLAEMEQVCDSATIIDRGHLVKSGSLDDIRSFAGEDSVLVTIEARDEAIEALKAAGMNPRPLPEPNRLAITVDPARSADINRTLVDAGLYLSGLESSRATLESAFLNLTGGPPPPTGPPALSPTSQPTGPPAEPPSGPPEESPPAPSPTPSSGSHNPGGFQS